MGEFLKLSLIIGVIAIVIWFMKGLIRNATNSPTWEGIIISALIGMLPMYLILCYFGVMGEKRYNDSPQSSGNYTQDMNRRYAYDSTSKKKWNWVKILTSAFIVLLLVCIFLSNRPARQEDEQTEVQDEIVTEKQEEIVEPTSNQAKDEPMKIRSTATKPKTKVSSSKQKNANEITPTESEPAPSENKRSTLDMLDEIQHNNIVQQAKEAGVSTEGSTLDMLERINHAEVVKQAKEAGVSTEGSTLDILERINHAEVVKQAKEAGVSTEGSTLDILERIQRKMLEELYE